MREKKRRRRRRRSFYSNDPVDDPSFDLTSLPRILHIRIKDQSEEFNTDKDFEEKGRENNVKKDEIESNEEINEENIDLNGEKSDELEREELGKEYIEQLIGRLPNFDDSGDNIDENNNKRFNVGRIKSVKPAVIPGKELNVSWPPSAGKHPHDLDEDKIKEILSKRNSVKFEGDENKDSGIKDDEGGVGELFIDWVYPYDGSDEISTNYVQISFSQDMVPVGDLEHLSASVSDVGDSEYFPVEIEPTPSCGRWRWESTSLLRFEVIGSGDIADDSEDESSNSCDSSDQSVRRLPMATPYTIKILQGTKSVDGKAVLRSDFISHFQTSPPTLKPYSCDPSDFAEVVDDKPMTIVLRFDQRVNARETLKHVKVTTGLLGLSSIANPIPIEDELPQNLTSRCIRFKLDRVLPKNISVSIKVMKAFSIEGPLVRTSTRKLRFRTLGPMKISYHSPEWPVTPVDSYDCIIHFTNEVDWTKSCSESKSHSEQSPLRITPTPRNFKVIESSGSHIKWKQAIDSKATYTVSLAHAGIIDVYGQPLTGWKKYVKIRGDKAYDEDERPSQILRQLDLDSAPYHRWNDRFLILDPHAIENESLTPNRCLYHAGESLFHPRFSFVSALYSEFRVCLYRLPGPIAHCMTPYSFVDGKKEKKDASIVDRPLRKMDEYKVFDKVISTADLRSFTRSKFGENDQNVQDDKKVDEEEVDIDLCPAFSPPHNQFGYCFVHIEPTRRSINNKSLNPFNTSWWKYRPYVSSMVVSTRLGVFCVSCPVAFIVLVTDTLSGEPIKGVDIWLWPHKQHWDHSKSEYTHFDGDENSKVRLLGTTDGSGTAVLSRSLLKERFLEWAKEKELPNSIWLVAKNGEDACWFDVSSSECQQGDTLWYTFDDRKLYKPKETVHVCGYLRYLRHRRDFVKKADSTLSPRSLPHMGMQAMVPQDVLAGKKKKKKEALLVRIRIFDPRGECILGESGDDILTATVSTHLGIFDFDFSIPDDCNLGTLRIEMTDSLSDSSHEHSIEVQEFRTPEYSSQVLLESPDPLFATPLPHCHIILDTNHLDHFSKTMKLLSNKKLKDTLLDDCQVLEVDPTKGCNSAIVSTKASYYAGGALSGAKTQWLVRHSSSSYSPKGWADYTFAEKAYPRYSEFWWEDDDDSHSDDSDDYNSSQKYDVRYGWGYGDNEMDERAITDKSGVHRIKLEWCSTYWPPKPVKVTAEATVLDFNNQTTIARTDFLIHPSSLYIGLKIGVEDILGTSWKEFTERESLPVTHSFQIGHAFPILFVVCDVNGNAIPNSTVHIHIKGSGINSDHSYQEVEETHSSETTMEDAVEVIEVKIPKEEEREISPQNGKEEGSEIEEESTSSKPNEDPQIFEVNIQRGCGIFMYEPPTGGAYEVQTYCYDSRGRISISTAKLNVEGPPSMKKQSKQSKQKVVTTSQHFLSEGEVEMKIERKIDQRGQFHVGEELFLTILPPFTPCIGTLFCVIGDDVFKVHFRVSSNEADKIKSPSENTGSGFGKKLPFTVSQEMIPRVSFHVICSGNSRNRKGTSIPTPGIAQGFLTLEVAEDFFNLSVDLSVYPTCVAPSAEVEVTINATFPSATAKESPIEGDVLLFGVDKAILDLAGYSPPSPLHAFLPSRGGSTSFSLETYRSILLRDLHHLSDSPQVEVGKVDDKEISNSRGEDAHSSSSDFSSDTECDVDERENCFPQAAKATKAKPQKASRLVLLSGVKKKEKSKAKGGGGLLRKKMMACDFEDECMDSPLYELCGGELNESEEEQQKTLITCRSDFDPLTFFGHSKVLFDESGKGTVLVKFNTKDTLTTYSIFAVVCTTQIVGSSASISPFLDLNEGEELTAGGKDTSHPFLDKQSSFFGVGKGELVCALPLMLRLTAPRFFNFGDQSAGISIILQNQTDMELSDIFFVARISGGQWVMENDKDIEKSIKSGQEIGLLSQKSIIGITQGFKFNLSPRQRAHFWLRLEPFKPPREVSIQVGVSSGDFSDAVLIHVPVYLPGTAQAFATSGVLDSDQGVVAKPIVAPANVHQDFGGLNLEMYSTQLNSLTDAMIYLYHYEYECNEQIASKLIGLLALRDVLYAFNNEEGEADVPESQLPPAWRKPLLPSKIVLDVMVGADIKRLADRQHSNGGFGYWGDDISKEKVIPFVSCHVAHALSLIKSKGYPIPEECYRKALKFVMKIESRLSWLCVFWSRESQRALRAYSLYVANKMVKAAQEDDPSFYLEKARVIQEKAHSFYQKNKKKLHPETIAWLMQLLVDRKTKGESLLPELKKKLMGMVHETSDRAEFILDSTDIGGDDAEFVIFRSSIRTDAAVLESLIEIDSKNKLIPKFVKGISLHRSVQIASNHCCSCWGNTHENSWVLLALDKYFSVYEKDDPDFALNVWFGGQGVCTQEFRRSLDRFQFEIPMKELVDKKQDQDPDFEERNLLLMMKDGAKGRCYYRLSLSYAPSDLVFNSANYGFEVRRTFSSVDHKSDVWLTSPQEKKQEKGIEHKERRRRVWKVKLGSRVKVTIIIRNHHQNYHIAMVDKLPAGFEALNPAIQASMDHSKVTKSTKFTAQGFDDYWFQHQNLRDERVEAFADVLEPGEHRYRFMCRATCKGYFVVPPTMVEEMYSPDIFGRSATEYVWIV